MPLIKLPNGGDRLVGRDGKLVHERDANGRLVAHEFGDGYVQRYNELTKDLDPRTGRRVHDGLVQRVRVPTLADALRPAPRTLADALAVPRRRKDEVGQPTTIAIVVNPDTGEEAKVPTWIAALVSMALDARASRTAALDEAGLEPEDEGETPEGFGPLANPADPDDVVAVPMWIIELLAEHDAAELDPIVDAYARSLAR